MQSEHLIAEAVQRAIHDTLPKAIEGLRQTRTEYLPTEDAAIYLGLSSYLLEQWRSQGGGPRFVKLSRLVRYPRAELDSFMLSQLQDHTV
jgi:predicted DNA-binding transcriptional regulator AlpA